ncbi:hypothetical protein MBLNU230_g5887t1 [Neophaeotheca triangularis]
MATLTPPGLEEDARRDSGFGFLPPPPADPHALNLDKKYNRDEPKKRVSALQSKGEGRNPFDHDPPSDGIPADLSDFEPSSELSSPERSPVASSSPVKCRSRTRRNAREQPLTEWEILSASELEPQLRSETLQLFYAVHAARGSGRPSAEIEAQLLKASTVLRDHLRLPTADRLNVAAVRKACGFPATSDPSEHAAFITEATPRSVGLSDEDSGLTLTSIASTRSAEDGDTAVDKGRNVPRSARTWREHRTARDSRSQQRASGKKRERPSRRRAHGNGHGDDGSDPDSSSGTDYAKPSSHRGPKRVQTEVDRLKRELAGTDLLLFSRKGRFNPDVKAMVEAEFGASGDETK